VSGVKRQERRRWLDAARHPTRRDGAILLALLLLPWIVAPILVLRPHHHLDDSAIAIVFAVSLGLPTLWATWAALRVAERGAAKAEGPGLNEIANNLASRLRSQWQHEAEARGLNDPYPLPVAWTAADAPLAGDLDALKTLAASGAGWSAPAREQWAKGLEDLAGGGGELAEVLARVPTGRLVVLGGPGAGKTMLMVRLVLDLLHPARRSSGGPVPVLASLASWDPVSQDLHGWLGATLMTSYPDLADAAPPGSAGGNSFEALLEAGLILPVLDGLDEVPESVRPVAMSRINNELKPGEQLVVTCRTEQYQAVVSPRNGHGIAMRAAAVQLCELQFDEISKYLRKDAGPAAESRWDFLDTLSRKSPARQALTTPLMAGLARAIYNPRPDERVENLRHPAELRNFTNQAAVEAHLFDAFIPAAYRHDHGGREKKHAEAWLVFLARHLEFTIHGPDLAWWQLARSTSRIVVGLATALITGLVTGLSIEIALVLLAAVSSAFGVHWVAVPTVGNAARTGLEAAPIAGLAVGVLSGMATLAVNRGRQQQAPWSPRAQVAARVAVAIIGGFVVGAAGWAPFGSVPAVGLGIIAAILAMVSAQRAHRSGASADLRQASAAGIVVGSMVGLTFGVLEGVLEQSFAGGLRLGLPWGIAAGIAAGVGTILKGRRGDRPAQGMRWSLRKGWPAASVTGVAAALIGVLSGGSAFGLSFGLIFGLTCTIALVTLGGFEGVPGDLAAGASPLVVLARDRSAALSLAMATGVAACIASGVVADAVAHTTFGPLAYAKYDSEDQAALAFALAIAASAGLTIGTGFGLIVSGFGSAWPGWLIARAWLALRGRLPWPLMSLLTDAHKRGVLRQVGAVYQFRHINLQHRLATRPYPDQVVGADSPAYS
jgi:NACHT domain